jgi:hypothetical protein
MKDRKAAGMLPAGVSQPLNRFWTPTAMSTEVGELVSEFVQGRRRAPVRPVRGAAARPSHTTWPGGLCRSRPNDNGHPPFVLALAHRCAVAGCDGA